MAKILIGCRLPNGLTLQTYDTPKNGNPSVKAKVTLAGLNKARVVGATHVCTEVEEEFWNAFKKANPNYAPISSGAIFEASTASQATAKAKELEKEKTGFEPMDPESNGVKPAVEEDEEEKE